MDIEKARQLVSKIISRYGMKRVTFLELLDIEESMEDDSIEDYAWKMFCI